MSIAHAKPGQVVSVRPLGPALSGNQTQTLIRGKDLEVIKLIVPPGKEISEHKVKGEILIQCLEGRVTFAASGKVENLQAGDFLYLPTGAPHSVKGVENASILLTVLLPKKVSEAEWGGYLPEPATVEEDETIRKRGLLLSVIQVAILVAGFALLFAVVAESVFVGAVSVVAVLAILGCLHYWSWGRWMSRVNRAKGQKTLAAR